MFEATLSIDLGASYTKLAYLVPPVFLNTPGQFKKKQKF